MAMVNVSWRGEVLGMEICRDEVKAAELRARWGGGPIIIERIFEMESASSTRGRCELANKVLRMFHEPLQLNPEESPESLSEALQQLSPDAAPLPEPVPATSFIPAAGVRGGESRLGPVPVAFRRGPRSAQEVVDELTARSPLTLTGAEKRELAAAKAELAGPEVEPEPLMGDASTPSEAFPEEMDPERIAQLHPHQLTGRQKAMLGGVSQHMKPRPRNVLTPDGRDPRTLTGVEKRALANQTRQRARQAPPPPVQSSGLTEAERSELGMLRAGQHGFEDAPDLSELQGDALTAGERFELALRRKWTGKAVVPRVS